MHKSERTALFSSMGEWLHYLLTGTLTSSMPRCSIVCRLTHLIASITTAPVTAVALPEVYDKVIEVLGVSKITQEVERMLVADGLLDALIFSSGFQIMVYGAVDSINGADVDGRFDRFRFCLAELRTVFHSAEVFAASHFHDVNPDKLECNIFHNEDGNGKLPVDVLKKLNNVQLILCDYGQVENNFILTLRMVSACFKFILRMAKDNLIHSDTLILVPFVKFDCDMTRIEFYTLLGKCFTATPCSNDSNPWFQANNKFSGSSAQWNNLDELRLLTQKCDTSQSSELNFLKLSYVGF